MKKAIIFVYQWIILLPVFLLTTIVTALTTIICSYLFGNKFWGYYPARIWSKITCYTAFCPVKVSGRENIDKNQSYIFIANHQGSFDIFLIYGFLGHNFRWIMKQELRKLPFVGAACAAAGHIFVDRSNTKSIKETLKNAKNQLTGGLSVVVFPEGSRTKNGSIGRFKKGAFQLATDLNLPIVPVTIDGPFRIMPCGTHVLNPTQLRMKIHNPISTEGLTHDDISDLMTRSFDVIKDGLDELRN